MATTEASHKRVSIPPDFQPNLDRLEQDTDKLFALRHELAGFYRRCGKYFPEPDKQRAAKDIEPLPSSARKRNIRSLYHAKLEGKAIEDQIGWDRVKADADKKYGHLDGSEKEIAIEVYTDQVRTDFERGLEIYQDLLSTEGILTTSAPQKNKQIKPFYRMRVGELSNAQTRIGAIEKQLARVELKRETLMARNASIPGPVASRLFLQYQAEQAELQQQIITLEKEIPEAYLFRQGRKLVEAKRVFDSNGTFVVTPYVESKIDRVVDIAQTRPVFIHGELGAGKTELARHVARTIFSLPHLRRWEGENPKPSKAQADSTAPDSEELRAWEFRKNEQQEALFIPGYRDIPPEQVIGGPVIERQTQQTPEAQVAMVTQSWETTQANLREQLADQGKTPEDIAQELSTLKDYYFKSYLEFFRSPVIAHNVLGPILRAMKEGRPVVIDEINAIPHHFLIALNEFIMRKPGDTVVSPFADVEPFVIPEGYTVIATGNYKPEDGLRYVGRQPIDAAFLSRFGIVHYDYLPMETEGEATGLTPEQQRKQRSQNELFHMMAVRLLNDDLSLTLPENGMRKLRSLARVARKIQDVFSGHPSSGMDAQVGLVAVPPQEVLKENVLSLRHLIPVIERWKRSNFTLSLDACLFSEYVLRSSARPDELMYLYRVLKTIGDFFPDSQGWPAPNETKRTAILNYPIEQALKQPMTGAPARTTNLSPIQVITELFGPRPARTTMREQAPQRTDSRMSTLEDERRNQRIITRIARQVKNIIDEGGYSV